MRMRNLINNANLLDQRGGDDQINSTFETFTGTTQAEIRRSKATTAILLVAALAVIAFLVILLIMLLK